MVLTECTVPSSGHRIHTNGNKLDVNSHRNIPIGKKNEYLQDIAVFNSILLQTPTQNDANEDTPKDIEY